MPSLARPDDEHRGNRPQRKPPRATATARLTIQTSTGPSPADPRFVVVAYPANDGFVMRAVPAGPTLIALPSNRIAPMRRVAPLRVADLEIDALSASVRQGPREIRLSPGEHMVLYTMAAKAGAVVSYRDMADALGRTEPNFRNNTVARHLSTLRRKLADDAHRPRYIETVLGVGYRLLSARKG